MSLTTMDQLIGDMRAAYAAQLEGLASFDPDNPFISSVNTFLMSEEMKRRIDVVISQKPHQRLLRKCQYRRIYRRRKRERKK